MENLWLKCVKCGELYSWTTGEQDFFARKGLEAPKQCRKCKSVRDKDGRTDMAKVRLARNILNEVLDGDGE